MLKLDQVASFVEVADGGSISEGARRLGLSKSVVSDRLAQLEQSLGVRLVQRTTRNMTLTEDGLAFLPRARKLVHDSAEAIAEVAARRGELSGTLRIAGPSSFGVLHLAPAISTFLSEHAFLTVALELDDRLVDLNAGGYDAVIRHGPVLDSWLTAIRLTSSRRVLVASEAYLAAHGEPRSLSELKDHCGILYSNRATDWRFEVNGEPVVLHPKARLRVNNGQVMKKAAQAGLGITLLPTFLLHGDPAPSSLRVLDVGAEAEGTDLHMIFPKHHGVSAALRAFIEHLRRVFGDPPYWDAPI